MTRLLNLGVDGYATKQAIGADLADLVDETLQGDTRPLPKSPTAGYARWVFRHLLVFALILVLLRRFTAIQVSILGSLALTVVVSLVISRLDRRGE